MRFAWFGNDPTQTGADPADYELGTRFQINRPVLLVGIRVHNPGTATAGGRTAKLWATDSAYANQSQVVSFTISELLPVGYSTWYFPTPFLIAATPWYGVVSYTVTGPGTGADYSFITQGNAAAITSPDNTITFPVGAGRSNATPGSYPASIFNNTYYGVDPLYEVASTVLLSALFPAADAAVATTANAEVASGTGTASGATVLLQPNASAGTGTGASGAPASKVTPTAGNAAGTGTAYLASATDSAAAGAATGTGTAYTAKTAIVPNATLSSGTGAAGAAASSVTPTGGNAAGTGAALAPTISIVATAGVATASGIAFAGIPVIAPNAGQATGTGASGGPASQLVVPASLAAGTGTAYDATTTEVETPVTPTQQVGGGISGRRGSYIQPVTIDVQRDDEELVLIG